MTMLEITVETLKEKLNNDSEIGILIDVREQDEWEAGHIPGATHLPKGQLLEQIQNLVSNKGQPIYLQCKSGGRSSQSAQWLIELGYAEVYNVLGGITAWKAASFPVE